MFLAEVHRPAVIAAAGGSVPLAHNGGRTTAELESPQLTGSIAARLIQLLGPEVLKAP